MKLHGVFVGINDYADPDIGGLRYASADAVAFHSLVRDVVAPSSLGYLTCLTDEHATRRTVASAIGEQLSRRAGQDDIVIVFFAGHGSPETDGSIDRTSRYLVMHDTEYENVFATGIDLERDLPRLCFERVRARLVVVFADTS